MNKVNIKNELIHHQEIVVSDLQKMIAQLKNSADIDEETTVKDIDDLSRADADIEVKQNLELTCQQAINDLETAKNINTDSSDQIGLGAIVDTGNVLFFIAIPSTGFDADGKHFIGISTAAPIYLAMKGKKQGDTFSFGKTQYTIKNIY